MVLLMETWPVRVILLAAKASVHSLQAARHPPAHTVSVLLPRFPVSLDRLKTVNAASSKTPRTSCMPLGFHQEANGKTSRVSASF